METNITGQSTNGIIGNYASDYISQAFSYPSNVIGGIAQTSRHSGIRGLGAGVQTLGSSLGGSIGKGVYDSILKNGLSSNSVSQGISTGFKNAFDFKGGWTSAGAGLGMNAAGAILSAIGGPKQEYSGMKGSVTKGLDSAYDVAQSAATFIPGVGTLVSGLMSLNKGVTGMLNKWGGGTDAMTDVDAVLGSNWFGPIGSINGFTGKRSHTMDGKDFMTQEQLGNMWSGYGDSYARYKYASDREGKKYGGFSSGARRRANRTIDKANMDKEYLLDMNRGYELGNIKGNNMAGIRGTAYNIALSGGFKPVSIGRQGFKISSLKEAINSIDKTPKKESIITPWKPTQEEITLFKQGGSMNLIPEGSLHARLHHMEDADGLTKKGIPVVDNEGNQQAEIELNEIIFRKEVTDKLEELSKDGSNEAAEEAGRILVEEIFENTDDRTGLIKELTGDTTVLKAEFGAAMPIYAEIAQQIIANNKAQKIGGWSQAIAQTGQALAEGLIDANNQQKQQQQEKKQTILNEMAQFKDEEQQRLAIKDAIAQKEAADNKDRADFYAQKYAMSAQEGDKLPEFKTFKELQEYLNKTGRGSDENYDLEAAYNDPEVYGYWREEELKNPGKGHWLDKYKKPSHITYSTESILGDNPKQNGGIWTTANGQDLFIVSPYLENKYSVWDYLQYFKDNEPKASFRYKEVTYGPKVQSKSQGGTIDQNILSQLLSLPPEKLKELQNILKYLGQ